jgi:hypothetical protein
VARLCRVVDQPRSAQLLAPPIPASDGDMGASRLARVTSNANEVVEGRYGRL